MKKLGCIWILYIVFCVSFVNIIVEIWSINLYVKVLFD